MTDNRDRLDPIACWHSTIDALEAVVLATPDQPGIDPAEAKEVRRLITMRLAARPNNLPAAWARRPRIVAQIVTNAGAVPETTERAAPKPPSPRSPARSRPAWHE